MESSWDWKHQEAVVLCFEKININLADFCLFLVAVCFSN